MNIEEEMKKAGWVYHVLEIEDQLGYWEKQSPGLKGFVFCKTNNTYDSTFVKTSPQPSLKAAADYCEMAFMLEGIKNEH